MTDYRVVVKRDDGSPVVGAEVIVGEALYGFTDSDGRVTEQTRGRPQPVRLPIEINGSDFVWGSQVTLRPDTDVEVVV